MIYWQVVVATAVAVNNKRVAVGVAAAFFLVLEPHDEEEDKSVHDVSRAI